MVEKNVGTATCSKSRSGLTPLTYLSILRVQETARLIRETDLLN